jgi:hypothetical protein
LVDQQLVACVIKPEIMTLVSTTKITWVIDPIIDRGGLRLFPRPQVPWPYRRRGQTGYAPARRVSARQPGS